jgi:uncharacterized membrane protein YfcA
MTAAALLSQGLSGLDDPSSSAPQVGLPLVGGVLAAASAALHHRLHERARYLEVASALIEAAICGTVGAASIARGTRYIQYAWFLSAVLLVGAAVVKWRGPRVSAPSAAPPESPAPATPEPPPAPDHPPPLS